MSLLWREPSGSTQREKEPIVGKRKDRRKRAADKMARRIVALTQQVDALEVAVVALERGAELRPSVEEPMPANARVLSPDEHAALVESIGRQTPKDAPVQVQFKTKTVKAKRPIPMVSPMDVTCEFCGQTAGSMCVSDGGVLRTLFHVKRLKAAETARRIAG